MPRHHWIWLCTLLVFGSLVALVEAKEVKVCAASSGSVLVNGNAVPKASSAVEIEKQVIEFWEVGGGPRLLPGPIKYRVCIESPRLVPAIEAACAPEAKNPYLEVTVEDGRSFSRCLVESSSTANRCDASGAERITRYCLRCER